MADLAMSEQERRIPLMDWDNENLGKAVKAAATLLYENECPDKLPGLTKLNVTTCALTLIAETAKQDCDIMEIIIKGASKRGVNLGDWKVVVERIY